MDTEQLYDSLDEDDLSATCQNYTVSSATWSEYDISSAVPLYLGDAHKEVFQKPRPLKSLHGSRIPIKCDSKRSYERIRTAEQVFQGKKFCNATTVDLLEFRRKDSYVNMFHAKNAKLNNQDKVIHDTVRSQYGDSTARSNISDVSNVTHFSDAQSTISDTTSFYFDIIKKMESRDEQPPKKSQKRRKSCSMASTTDNLTTSGSEFSVCNSVKSKGSKGILDAKLLVPKMGGLGPDLVSTQEKLTRLQKQKSYGQKASDHNRIKMLEIKVLKELKAEIKNSKA